MCITTGQQATLRAQGHRVQGERGVLPACGPQHRPRDGEGFRSTDVRHHLWVFLEWSLGAEK